MEGILDEVDPAWMRYTPNPQGLLSTRQAIAAYQQVLQGIPCDPEDLWLTASTSEAYATLFKVFCDSGDSVLVPVPGYPLLDALAGLENLHTHPYFLREGAEGWEIDLDSLHSLPERTRLLLVVAPHNPTGHTPSESQWLALLAFCAEHGLVLVVDEVFGAYRLDGQGWPHWLTQAHPEVPVFWLDGLSKTAGQPQLKLGWMRCHLPRKQAPAIRHALEYVLDAQLSVSSLAQALCAPLLARVPPWQALLKRRLMENRALAQALLGKEAISRPAAGGWYQCVRLNGIDDESFCLELLERKRVLVQPGFFFDFTSDEWLVLSLLPQEPRWSEALALISQGYEEWRAGSGRNGCLR